MTVVVAVVVLMFKIEITLLGGDMQKCTLTSAF